MPETRTYYCLRCQARFPMSYERNVVVERSCPQCGSNSVRAETPAAAASRQARGSQ